MDSFNLVSSLQALPETDPVAVDGIQFGPTCQNNQAASNSCLLGLTIGVNLNTGVLQTLVGGIAIPIAILGQAAGQGC